jgi:hypothetical protein
LKSFAIRLSLDGIEAHLITGARWWGLLPSIPVATLLAVGNTTTAKRVEATAEEQENPGG